MAPPNAICSALYGGRDTVQDRPVRGADRSCSVPLRAPEPAFGPGDRLAAVDGAVGVRMNRSGRISTFHAALRGIAALAGVEVTGRMVGVTDKTDPVRASRCSA